MDDLIRSVLDLSWWNSSETMLESRMSYFLLGKWKEALANLPHGSLVWYLLTKV
jgi:hypothetical protein